MAYNDCNGYTVFSACGRRKDMEAKEALKFAPSTIDEDFDVDINPVLLTTSEGYVFYPEGIEKSEEKLLIKTYDVVCKPGYPIIMRAAYYYKGKKVGDYPTTKDISLESCQKFWNDHIVDYKKAEILNKAAEEVWKEHGKKSIMPAWDHYDLQSSDPFVIYSDAYESGFKAAYKKFQRWIVVNK